MHSSLLFALLLAFTGGCSTVTFFIIAIFILLALLFLIFLLFGLIITVFIIIAIIVILVHAKHVKVLVQTEIVLQSVGNQDIVEIFNYLLNFINFIPYIILVFTVNFSLFLGILPILENIKEGVSIHSFDDSPGLSSLLMFLLLFYLLLCWILALEPIDFCAFHELYLVFSLVFKAYGQGCWSEEVVSLFEFHFEGQDRILGLFVLLRL